MLISPTNQSGFHSWSFPKMGLHLDRWMIFVRENPNLKWMRTGGTPTLGNPQIIRIFLSNPSGFLSLNGRHNHNQQMMTFFVGLAKMVPPNYPFSIGFSILYKPFIFWCPHFRTPSYSLLNGELRSYELSFPTIW